MSLSNGRLLGLSIPWAAAPGRSCALAARAAFACCSPRDHRRHWPPTTRRGYAAAARQPRRAKLDLLALDQKWQAKWAEQAEQAEKAEQTTQAEATSKQKYILPMFPYPSGNLHLGHLRVYTIADAVARFHRLQGADVLLPMGWDAFGLPAENAARERGAEPGAWTRANIARMRAQLDRMNGSWDWAHELSTCEPEFYGHTQRLFLELHRRGLAYQADAEVNYDPVDQTVLANEQVDAQGRSWRSGALVEKRQLRQWFLRISAYREPLLRDLDGLARDGAWPERVLAMQRHWLGRSAGAVLQFPLLSYQEEVDSSSIDVFTTRIDTLPGVQYVALAASHPLVQRLAAADPQLQAFLDTLPGLPPDAKEGYLLPNVRAINPLAYHTDAPVTAKASLPVFVASYVLGGYGEGAVMGVPGHDVRDHAFWQAHGDGQPVRVVLAASEKAAGLPNERGGDEPYVGHGYMTAASGPFCGQSSQETAAQLLALLEPAGLARAAERWRLRDWLISRQRYWGTPIPIVHCASCGAVPVPETDLPVMLPDVSAHFASPSATSGNPLASEAARAWAEVPCPACGEPARRDTDTMDTFVDSSWYYMRFVDAHNAAAPFDPARARAQLPVDIYLGGIEHAILHLLYARFVYKVLMGQPGGEAAEGSTAGEAGDQDDAVHEPFARLISQGMVHGRTFVDPETGRFLKPDEVEVRAGPEPPVVRATGAPATVAYEKMSKSKHNGVDPTEMVAKYGADATRAHMLFQAPVADVVVWDEDKMPGVTRWLGRLHELVADAADGEAAAADGKEGTSVAEDLQQRAPSASDGDVPAAALARWDADAALWREVQTTIASVTASYDKVYALNTVVSDLMRLTNSVASAAAEASPSVIRAALSALLRMLAPITPAVAEEGWSLLGLGQGPLFGGAKGKAEKVLFPQPDGSLAWLQPRRSPCAVQVNGRLRCAVALPPPPAGLAGDALRNWLVEAILATDEGRAKLGRASGRDIRQAKRAIVVGGGKLVNFLL